MFGVQSYSYLVNKTILDSHVIINSCRGGGMADAQGLGPCVRKDVGVQLLSPAQKEIVGVGAGRARPRGQRRRGFGQGKFEPEKKK